uniref:RING-type domain-containing protein n=2 Tax=Anopheles atroparvus TaxID=41427 RepID=A0AAG5D5L5_ANOAO
MNLVCSICSEIYEPHDDVNITACGHMFHRACLLPWIERSATCPHCRSSCTEARLTKVYLNTATDQTASCTTDRTREHILQQQIDELKIKTHEQQNSLKHLEKTVLDISAIQHQNNMMRDDLKKLKEDLERVRGRRCILQTPQKPGAKPRPPCTHEICRNLNLGTNAA